MIHQFKNYLDFRGYTDAYYRYAQRFLTYCKKNNINHIIITDRQMENYFQYLKSLKLQNGSINNHIKGLKLFYKFLHGHNWINLDIGKLFHNLKILKVDRKIKETFTIEELEEMIKFTTMFSYSAISNLKIKTIILFMFYTGVRLKEFLNLKRKDIDIDKLQAIIRIPTKNRNERIVLFTKEVAELIKQYYKEEPQENINTFNITKPKLKWLINSMKIHAPNKKPFSAHILRHSFANMLARNMIDIRIAQKLLGHKNIESTAIYYDPDIETIKQIYADKVKKNKRRKKK
jgi:integrase/recombinase XerD